MLLCEPSLDHQSSTLKKEPRARSFGVLSEEKSPTPVRIPHRRLPGILTCLLTPLIKVPNFWCNFHSSLDILEVTMFCLFWIIFLWWHAGLWNPGKFEVQDVTSIFHDSWSTLVAIQALKTVFYTTGWRNIQILSRWSVNGGYVDTWYTCGSDCLGWPISGHKREAICFRDWTGSTSDHHLKCFQVVLKVVLSRTALLTAETYNRNTWRWLPHLTDWPQMFHFTKFLKEMSHASLPHIFRGILQKQMYVTHIHFRTKWYHNVLKIL